MYLIHVLNPAITTVRQKQHRPTDEQETHTSTRTNQTPIPTTISPQQAKLIRTTNT
jgi:hypothetical protein